MNYDRISRASFSIITFIFIIFIILFMIDIFLFQMISKASDKINESINKTQTCEIKKDNENDKQKFFNIIIPA